jgi:acyl phosphate:glycerol-3-phosphate acyltransferase
MPPAVGLVLAYLAGSIPAAYLAGRLTKGIDLREHGSGNLGATNVYRVLGAKIAALVFLVDVAKGALPVWLLPRVTATAHPELWAIAYGLLAVAGHVRPIFLLGKGGGKGVATATGVFLALAPLATLLAFTLWLMVVGASGYVSLASLTAAVVLPIAVLVQVGADSPVFIVAVLLAAFVFWTHRENIRRLRRGEEHRFGRRGGKST